MDFGIFRTQTQSMPTTAAPLSAPVTKRATTTATKPIQQNLSNPVVNISNYTTIRGAARQGVTPSSGKLRPTESASGTASIVKNGRGLFR